MIFINPSSDFHLVNKPVISKCVKDKSCQNYTIDFTYFAECSVLHSCIEISNKIKPEFS